MSTTMETDELARLGVAKRGISRQRQKRVLLAKLLRERSEGADEYEGEEDTGDEGDTKVVRALIGSRILRRRRVRKLLLAHLARERAEAGEEGEEFEEDVGDEETGEAGEGNIVRALAASRILRRRRTRKLLLAHLIRERNAAEEEGDEDVDEESGGEEDNQILRVLVGSRILKRRRARRMLFAYLRRQGAAGETGEEEEEFEEDEDFGENGGGDNRIFRALVGSRILRRRRTRKLLLAHLLRQQGEDVA